MSEQSAEQDVLCCAACGGRMRAILDPQRRQRHAEHDALVPVSLIEHCLRLRNADGTHRVPAEARNIIRAAMDGYVASAKSQLGVEATRDAVLAELERLDATEQPTVCIAHGNFIPCRKDGEHRHTTNPYWVKSVRDYQTSPIDDLTWEPAWLATDAAAYEWPENFGREEWWAE